MRMHTITLVHICAKRRKKTTRPVPWLRRFVVGLAPHGLEFDLRAFQVGFCVEGSASGKCFPLSVSIDKCSILIHSSTTDAMQF